MTENSVNPDNPVRSNKVNTATISALIVDLGNKNGLVRVKARRSLVAMGEKAVSPLAEALANPREWVRWEAAKALGQIGNPVATQALVRALEDEMFDVRWLAAEALLTIGKEALAPLLKALIRDADSVWLREGAHHVFHDLADRKSAKILMPVLIALEDIEPSVEVPPVAAAALNALAES